MSRYIYIQLDLPVTYFTYSRQDMENFRQDEFVWTTNGCSVENYVTDIIDKLIWHQDKLTLTKTESKVLKTDSQVLTAAEHNCVVNNHQDLQFDTLEHLAIHSKLDITVAGKRPVNCDIVIPHKTRGFLNHEKKIKFIGPDRQPVKIETIDQCITLAQILRATGKPNYVSARIPLVSGLNIDAWEFPLRDYHDPFVLQYRKFGFPLSLTHPDYLSNTSVVNHYSATAYPSAINDYIDKELEHGALLGPAPTVSCQDFHCSPLLSRPKDGDKRRVILNLSHPNGGSLNDNVGRAKFDAGNLPYVFQ